jgi:hypothetical protein
MPPGPGRHNHCMIFVSILSRVNEKLGMENLHLTCRGRGAACQVLLRNFKFKLNKPVQLH